MPVNLKEIKSQVEWNKFIIDNFDFYSFLQSWEWGEFNKLEGNRVWRFGIFDGPDQIGAMQVLKVSARRGTYLFCPHGPLITNNYFKVLQEILPELKNLAEQEGAGFIRFNPQSAATIENEQDYKKLGFRNAPMHVHAESTWLLDLNPKEEDLLAGMRKTTRYLIRRAEKEGVEIKMENSPEAVALFYALHEKHSNRDNGHGYTAFSCSYIDHLLQSFSNRGTPSDTCHLIPDIRFASAWYDGLCEASLATIKFGNFAVYYLGASDIKHPKFSPAYLLQWRAILDARESGCRFYNFWGISPQDNPRHPIYGVSQFKKGFGGFGYELLHAQDLVLDRKYWLNWAIETIRRKKRGYFYPKPISKESFVNANKLTKGQNKV